jgi:hypothetical protein
MIIHDGKSVPKDTNPWDPNAVEWVTMVWDNDVSCHGDIVVSTWLLPDNWTQIDVRVDVPIVDCDSNQYTHGNQILLSTTNTEGTFTFTNRVQFTDSTVLDRSIKFKLKAT